MKEAVSTREVNQFLAGERTKLQSEKNHVEKELEQERQNSDKRKSEVNEVIRKVRAITPVISQLSRGGKPVPCRERTRLQSCQES